MASSPAPSVVKMSLRTAASEAADSPRGQRTGIASIRRNTVMLARDVLLRRFSRNDTSSPFRFSLARGPRFTLEEFDKLVHEINYMVAGYRQLLQSLGANAESSSVRQELSSSRQQCLRTCDTAKNCILPQLKSETHDHHQSSEVTKHASHQFIGCVNMFISEMRRCHSLLQTLPAAQRVTDEPNRSAGPLNNEEDEELQSLSRLICSLVSTMEPSSMTPQIALDASRARCKCCGRAIPPHGVRPWLEGHSPCTSCRPFRDLKEAESILETLENAITVHFSIDPPPGGDAPVPAQRTRKKGCQFGKLCANFKTSYA